MAGDAGAPAARPFGLARWVALVTIGTTVGAFIPGGVYVLARRVELPAWGTYPLLAVAGALMGILVGAGQASALWGTRLSVPRAAWTVLTAAACLGILAFAFAPFVLREMGQPLDFAQNELALLLMGGVALFLGVVPAAQVLLLRRVVRGAWRWIPLGALAWGAAGAWVLFAAGQPLPTSGWTLRVALYAATAALVGLTAATISGVGLRWMAARSRVRSRDASR